MANERDYGVGTDIFGKKFSQFDRIISGDDASADANELPPLIFWLIAGYWYVKPERF